MRIIGGIAGGRILKAPKGLAVRPTPDLVRQAVFNSLGGRIVDADVLELYAGTGALSLESLSRGARSAVCVELSSRHAAFIRDNLRTAGLPADRLELRVQDAFAALRQLAEARRQFDIVFADPPYGEKNVGRRSESHAQKLLDDPRLPSLIRSTGLFVLGHARRDEVILPDREWRERRCLRHGDSMMRLLETAQPVLPASPNPEGCDLSLGGSGNVGDARPPSGKPEPPVV